MRLKSISAKPRPVLAHVEQDFAPGIDHQAVPEGIAAILMMTELRGGDDEQARLDRARPEQNVPMRLARRNGEGRRDRDHIRIGFGKPREQPGKRRS